MKTRRKTLIFKCPVEKNISPCRAPSPLAHSLPPIHPPSRRPSPTQAASRGTLVLWPPAAFGPQELLAGPLGRGGRGLIPLPPPLPPQLWLWPELHSSISAPSSCRGTPHPLSMPATAPCCCEPPKCCMFPAGASSCPRLGNGPSSNPALTSVHPPLGSQLIKACDKLNPSGHDGRVGDMVGAGNGFGLQGSQAG